MPTAAQVFDFRVASNHLERDFLAEIFRGPTVEGEGNNDIVKTVAEEIFHPFEFDELDENSPADGGVVAFMIRAVQALTPTILQSGGLGGSVPRLTFGPFQFLGYTWHGAVATAMQALWNLPAIPMTREEGRAILVVMQSLKRERLLVETVTAPATIKQKRHRNKPTATELRAEFQLAHQHLQAAQAAAAFMKLYPKIPTGANDMRKALSNYMKAKRKREGL